MSAGTTYRLYVGAPVDLRDVLREATALGIEGFAVTRSTGVWRGVEEPCAIVEVVEYGQAATNDTHPMRVRVHNLGRRLCTLYNQEAVCITAQTLNEVLLVDKDRRKGFSTT